MNKLRIIYMGTPEFAVPPLEKLIQCGYDVASVITAPDKPAGRGMELQMSDVKKVALRYNIPVLQPEKLKNPDFIEQLKSYNANLQIVVAFRMLPEAVWSMPQFGTFNLHASLLPQYRGAAPINHAIINGEKETGLTTFFLKHEIDTGNIILQTKEPIMDTDNVGTLYERLKNKGADLVLKTVRLIEEGNFTTTPQILTGNLKEAPKIFKPDCKINFNQPVERVHNFVRGLSPYPAAFTMLDNKILKIFTTQKTSTPSTQMPGSVVTNSKNTLEFATADFNISVLELQLEGKKRTSAEEFLRGRTI